MADPTITVQPPTRRPRKGGISTVADFRTDNRLFIGALPVYDALPCSLEVESVELCYVDSEAVDKVPEGIEIAEAIGPTFGGYMGVECFVGPWDDYADRARASLEAAQDRVIEEALSDYLATLGPGTGSADLVTLIANLESEADAAYVGGPTILISRYEATIAASQFALFPDPSFDGRLWTANGTPVLASSQFDVGRVYSVGALTVLQSEIVVSEGYALTTNRNMAIAERAFNILIDCDYVAIGELEA